MIILRFVAQMLHKIMSHYNFYLRENYVNTSGKCLILIRYYEDRKTRVQINTGINISPRYWSKVKSSLKNSSEIPNEVLEFDRVRILADTIINHYKTNKKKLTKDRFKQHFLKNDISDFSTQKVEFYNELDSFIAEKTNQVVPDVIKDYKSLRKHLLEFDEFTNDITTFESIDIDFYKAWTNFLANHSVKRNNEVGLKNNTIGKQVKNLKAFLNDRIKSKKTPPIDLKDFKVIQEETDHIYLNKVEIESISELEYLDNSYEERVRDFFVIGCLTGLRFSDIIRIKPDYIKNGYIELRQKKTSKKVIVPMRNEVVEILKKYDNYSPKVAINDFNKIIKKLGYQAKINDPVELEHKKGNRKVISCYKKFELISSHTCRRSFCTNAYLEGIDTHLIMQISGHKTEKAFKRYLKLSSYEAAQKMKEAWGI